jgi:AbrB family looped-hinge helix DNA binding protein
MAVSRVTRNFQITVPREIREMADVKVGDVMLFAKEGEQIVLHKIDKELMGKGFGLWKRAQEKTPWLMNKLLRPPQEAKKA